MNTILSQEQAPANDRLDLAVIADRIGWEEREIIKAARSQGANAQWLNDGALCCGSRVDIEPAGTYLIRSKSFVRGPLIAEAIAADDQRVVNSSQVIALCSNKAATLASLSRAGIPTVPYRLVLSREDLSMALGALGSPLVLKPVYGGLGRRVLLVRDPSLADSVYDYIDHFGQGFDRAVIAQPYLIARDLRVLAVGNKPVAAMERVPTTDWRANVEMGADVERTPITPEIEWFTARVAEATGAQVFGLDMFRIEDEILVSEVNHVPQFKGIVEATELDVAAMMTSHALALQGV